MQLAEDVLAGSRIAIAKAITKTENEHEDARELMRLLYPHTGKAHIIGITGPPGSGKSTLTDKIIKECRRRGKTVGVIAVDPTSPFSGGAILGDRIRMVDLTLDEGVFIRSMGTRGSLGGLSRTTTDAVKIMDAAGMDLVFIETVGVGQSEVDIVKTADSIVVALVPGLGDDIQAIKAGILEIGDIFIINKADREGVERLNSELNMMLDLNLQTVAWRPPVLRTVAAENQGIVEFVDTINEHMAYLRNSGQLAARRKTRTQNEIMALLEETILRHISEMVQKQGNFAKLVGQVAERKVDSYTVVQNLLTVFSNSLGAYLQGGRHK